MTSDRLYKLAAKFEKAAASEALSYYPESLEGMGQVLATDVSKVIAEALVPTAQRDQEVALTEWEEIKKHFVNYLDNSVKNAIYQAEIGPQESPEAGGGMMAKLKGLIGR